MTEEAGYGRVAAEGSGQACGVLAVGYIHFPKDFFASFFGLQKMKRKILLNLDQFH